MTAPGPERAPTPPRKVGAHAAWAMAVGGMIGGGIFTLAGVVLAAAGSLAWLSLAIGGAIALATVTSYARLTLVTKSDSVPMNVLSTSGRRGLARLLAWTLMCVYILALAVYTFTLGHYLGHAFGLGRAGIALIEVVAVGVLVLVNLLKVAQSTTLQIVVVWIELAILVALAAFGLVMWNPAGLTEADADVSPIGVLVAAALTFVAFEGFEMLAYDVREMQRPRNVMRTQLPRAVIAVAIAYGIVVIGAASLVGANTLIVHAENALAEAGLAAAGMAGYVVVTIAACAAAISAINATLFSVSRLARSTAERGLMPSWCARCNRNDAPMWAVIVIGVSAVVIASVADLDRLVSIASLGFLGLFCLVNVMAMRRAMTGRLVSAAGAFGAATCVVVIVVHLLGWI